QAVHSHTEVDDDEVGVGGQVDCLPSHSGWHPTLLGSNYAWRQRTKAHLMGSERQPGITERRLTRRLREQEPRWIDPAAAGGRNFAMDSPWLPASLPFALGVVMFGLGLALIVDDFRLVGRHPKAVVISLLCQVVLLPVVCFGLVLAFRLPPALAVGMMLLATSPGGPTANLYSHLFGGHVALNVTLTAINSVLVVVTMPVVVNLSAGYFLSGEADIGLPLGKVLQVFTIVLVP